MRLRRRYATVTFVAEARILLVDDEVALLGGMSRVLARAGYDVIIASNAEEGIAIAQRERPQLILLDVHMPGSDGLATMRALRQEGVDAPILMMSGAADVATAVRAVRHGALDFLEKPVPASRLEFAVQQALRGRSESTAASKSAGSASRQEVGTPEVEILGEHASMLTLRSMVARAAASLARVLITGENGSGKDLVAQAIHRGSVRNGAPFVMLNCGAVPAELIESELFGHEKGAFTGAVTARKGKFELAHGGTLFLDEVGDMPPAMQVKLLRAVQQGEIEPVGAGVPRRVDVRVVAATNRDVQAMVEKGTFREDLYYRLAVIELSVPPLRERKTDIPLLATHFFARQPVPGGATSWQISDEALRRLTEHDYPGNVRELGNIIERIAVFIEKPEVTGADVDRALRGARTGTRSSETNGLQIRTDGVPNAVGPSDSTATLKKPSGASHMYGEAPSYEPGLRLKDYLDAAEKYFIEAAISHHGGNMAETARSLGMERSHLYKRCRTLGSRRADS